MREIKFRAWDLNNRKMYDTYIVDENGSFCVDGDFTNNCECSEEDRVIQMQFTGSKDKNEKEIYEGDIVKWTYLNNGSPYSQQGIVEFSDCAFKVPFTQILNQCKGLSSIDEDKGIEVIGNIYKNPEFAEQKKGERQ